MSKSHWESVYTSKKADEVSWYQTTAQTSLSLIEQHCPDSNTTIIDVGAGASTLVDGLLQKYHDISLLDLSAAALGQTAERLKEQANTINWLEGSILEVDLPQRHFDVWHDRAVFHFLTEFADRQRYVEQALTAIKPDGLIIIATFGEEGPSKCSGLPVRRYNPSQLHQEFGEDLSLVCALEESHTTPWNTMQQFVYCVFKKNNSIC